jgi:outer membrane protein assembly factor BamB
MMPDPYDVFLSSPVIANSVVYFGSGDHHVYALDAATGAVKWKFKTGNVVHASPAVVDGVVYIGSWDRYMYALSADSGKVIWKFQTGDDTEIYNQVGIASSAAVSGGLVFFGCRDGHFYAVDQKTGAQKWSIDNHKGWTIASPAVYDGVVYFPTSDGMRFKAVEAATGKVLIDLENKATSFSSPAIVGDIVYYGTSDGVLHALDRKSGKARADFKTDGYKEWASKYIDGDGHISNSIYTEQTLEGAILGLNRMYLLGTIHSSPVVADGVLYVGSTDGNL